MLPFQYMSIHIAVSNRKRKPRHFSLLHLTFIDSANGSLLFVPLLTRKPTEVIRLQTD